MLRPITTRHDRQIMAADGDPARGQGQQRIIAWARISTPEPDCP
jgi:hypothetical protein